MVATPNQVINNVYSSISKSIIESMQTAQNMVFTSQDINIKCDPMAIASMSYDVNRCIIALSGKKDIDTIRKLCKPAIQCKATNISMKSSLNVTNIINQTATIKQNIDNSLSNNITQGLNSLDSSLVLGDSDKLKIDNITSEVSNNTQNITQEVYDGVVQQQGLTLNNYEANNITMTNVSKVVLRSVQGIKGLQQIISDVSNDIVQKVDTSTEGTLNEWVIKIFSIFMGIVLLLFFILYVVKRHDTQDFIRMIIPYVIFIIGCIIISSVHVLFKPDYVCVDDNEEVKKVDKYKLIFWVSLFSILLGAAEIIYYRIIKKRSK